MGKPAKVQRFSSLFLSKPSFLCVVVVFLLPSLVFTYLQGSSFSHFVVTIPVLILSTSFLVTFTKKKKEITLSDNQVQDENPRWDLARDLVENEAEEKQQQEIQNVAAEKAAKESDLLGLIHEPADFVSESESTDEDNDSTSSENLDLNWVHNGDQNEVMLMDSSDSVSEDDENEDGLIEIAIPNSKSSDFLPESIFNQQGLMELLADINEVNEEENLIEIDISEGSIKCSRFEIEA
ncbi:hypothetical protein Patl1_03954 [Pistacia atlantica]|uniref:Uncharacterized protein n=1 Tax=Pistacia atlantica TaxID=434234 RepID=A0ACC1BSH1_9ROSI|nr:hypothetical protein Patl1_03954 [Pistacia atlantica]